MPLYVYQSSGKKGCDSCRGTFEVVQKFADDPLANCPACGAAVARVIGTPAIHGASRSAERLSNKNLEAQGFTKYVKAGDGHFEKVAGKKGPRVIKR